MQERRSNNHHSPSGMSKTKENNYESAIDEERNAQVKKENTATKDSNDDYGRTLEKDEKGKSNRIEESASSHPLFSHGMCRWTGCELAGFKTLHSFKQHLSLDHVLDERSTAQTRVQVRTYIFKTFNNIFLPNITQRSTMGY